MTAPELLPCPFCGCTTIVQERMPGTACYYNVCDWCGSEGPAEYPDSDTPQGWNVRTPSPEVAALIAEARREGWNAAIEAAAALAHPPQWERKGKPGLWRLRRAKIAAAIRALREETP